MQSQTEVKLCATLLALVTQFSFFSRYFALTCQVTNTATVTVDYTVVFHNTSNLSSKKKMISHYRHQQQQSQSFFMYFSASSIVQYEEY